MAARMRKTHQDDVRKKIQASALINVLTDCAMGKKELSSARLTSIKILLDKSLPDLSDIKVEHNTQGITFNLNTGVKPKAE